MRPYLKNIDEDAYWTYGLDVEDFDHVYNVVKRFILLSQKEIEKQRRSIVTKHEDPEISCEIVSDISHYAWCEEQYLWEFCLWRLQGIFEALLVDRYVDKEKRKRLLGLDAKIEEAKKRGLKITDQEVAELKSWAKLRNALSHAPTEKYRSVPLEEGDISDYMKFVKKILANNA